MNPAGANGAFYGNWHLLLAQIIAVIMAILISVTVTAVSLLVIQWMVGLRTAQRYEEDGLDDIHEEKIHETSILRDASSLLVHKIKDFPWKEMVLHPNEFFTTDDVHHGNNDIVNKQESGMELEQRKKNNGDSLLENAQAMGSDNQEIVIDEDVMMATNHAHVL